MQENITNNKKQSEKMFQGPNAFHMLCSDKSFSFILPVPFHPAISFSASIGDRVQVHVQYLLTEAKSSSE